MTILSAAQSAARRLNQAVATSLYSSSEAFDKEIAELANESAVEIAKAHDWQQLMKLHTLTGDGATTDFSLPSDYDRMPLKGRIQSSNFALDPVRARDEDQWLYYQLNPQVTVPALWTMLGGYISFNPAIPTGQVNKFYYIRNTPVVDNNGGLKTSFTADTDSLVLPERLLTLDLIWRWRASKKMEYAEDMANFERAAEFEITKDKGARILRAGHQRFSADVTTAYPLALG